MHCTELIPLVQRRDMTALRKALKCLSVDEVRTFVDRHGRSLLHVAAQSHFAEAIPLLSDMGVPVNGLRRGDWTPLMCAVAKGESDSSAVDTVTMLLKYNASTSAQNSHGETPLVIAAEHYCATCAMKIIEWQTIAQAQCSIPTTTCNGRTVLHAIAAANATDAYQSLLELILRFVYSCRSDLIKMRNAEGATPFMIAARHNNVAFMKTLTMKSNEDTVVDLLNTRDKLSRNALDYATIAHANDAVQYLIELQHS